MGQVSGALDADHQATLDLLAQVEGTFVRAARVGTEDRARVAGALVRLLTEEVDRHFGFEERDLFPRLARAGDGDLAELLAEEHVSIRAVAAELLPIARKAAAGTAREADLDALRRGASELCERLAAHIHKETMALLPAVDAALDGDEDRELAFAYATA